MDRHLLTGIAWTAAAKWSSQILTWASLLVVARLLLPSDFGIVGMAAVYLGILKLFSEFGVGSAVITIRNLSEQEIAQINSFSVIVGIIGFLLSCSAAIPLGWFFRSPQLPAVVIVMSTGFIITGFQTVPFSLLQRDFRFKLLSAISTFTALAQSLCVLLLAWTGFRYWSLVVGDVTGTLLLATLNVAWRPCHFACPRLKSIRHAIHFSLQLVIARLSWAFYSDADFLVAGRVLGANALGGYTFAWNLATLPVEKITTLAGQVTPSVFSAIQTNTCELRRYFQTLTEALSLITFPTALGLGLVAPEFVPLVLGKAWHGAIVPLQILAYYGSVRSISALLGPLLTALRETRLLMWSNLAGAVIMPIAFYIGSRWGPPGIACGWVVAYPVVALPLYHRALSRINLTARMYLDAIRPSISASLVMIASVYVVKLVFPVTWPLYERLALEIACGAATYLAVLLIFHLDRIRVLATIYRTLRATDAATTTIP